jgi:hypothetical protein
MHGWLHASRRVVDDHNQLRRPISALRYSDWCRASRLPAFLPTRDKLCVGETVLPAKLSPHLLCCLYDSRPRKNCQPCVARIDGKSNYVPPLLEDDSARQEPEDASWLRTISVPIVGIGLSMQIMNGLFVAAH